MKIGVIGIKGAWSSEQLAEAVAKKTGQDKMIFEMQDVRLDLPSGRAKVEGHDLSTFDALIIKKSVKNIHRICWTAWKCCECSKDVVLKYSPLPYPYSGYWTG